MNSIARRLSIGVAVLVVAAAAAVQKALYLAADPTGEKDCPPLENPGSLTVSVTGSTLQLPWAQKGGTIDDASCLDKTAVYGIVQVRTEEDIGKALKAAQDHNLKVSIAGVRHSMGGQAFARNAIVLDMREFKKVSVDESTKVISVQSGATWHDIQNFLHPKFSIKAMQSTDIFTVGGSIAVNAHGMDHHAGSVARTVRSMRVMLPDGTVQTLSRTQNPELFWHVIGGYGLFGVVLDAQIDITENVFYEPKRRIVATKDLPTVFAEEVLENEKYGLFYAHLSTSPGSLLDEAILYLYETTDEDIAKALPLHEVGSVKLRRFVLNLSKKGALWRRLKWFAEKYLEPKLESCSVTRSQAMQDGEGCLVSRNEPMHDSVPYLRNALKNDTDILHEYFVPRSQLLPFIDGMKNILTKHDANLLNASVRVVHKEENALSYAPEDAFAVVLYINQTTDRKGNQQMAAITSDLIDLTSQLGGRFFLPYQLHYTPEQLRQSYPEVDAFFAMKRKYDPKLVLTNTWFERFGKATISARPK